MASLETVAATYFMMSAENEAVAAADEVCASCGTAAVDDVKLKICACKLVKYCTIDCQKNHRPQHKKLCRKRLAEIRDRDLFEQPRATHYGECPICCLPLSIHAAKNTINDCCSKIICNGCNYANIKREIEAGLGRRCAFCREPVIKTREERDKRVMKRIKKNDPVAIRYMGQMRRREGDYESAVEYFTKAAELGDTQAHHELSVTLRQGEGVEKDAKGAIYHAEEAAIGGHPEARHNLGCEEFNYGRFERAAKHFIIAANLGVHESLQMLMQLHADGHASKEEYEGALRGYQAALDETKSVERDEADAFFKRAAARQDAQRS